ncbi:MAG: DNA-directed RNA polymerase subunit K [Candidatus Altiarchaeales archaeon]|nr:DNA-directed RNA polymerase subunit K [Candidatus Altiarchaeales archaeon]
MYTKFEKARLLGARSFQLELGAPPMIKVTDPKISAMEIAKAELKHDLLPITVKK